MTGLKKTDKRKEGWDLKRSTTASHFSAIACQLLAFQFVQQGSVITIATQPMSKYVSSRWYNVVPWAPNSIWYNGLARAPNNGWSALGPQFKALLVCTHCGREARHAVHDALLCARAARVVEGGETNLKGGAGQHLRS